MKTSGVATTRPVRPAPGEVVAVMNPDDDVAVAGHLAAIHDLDQGRIVGVPRDTSATSARGSLGLARKKVGAALLAALGKDPADIADNRGQALALAGYWMRGERVGDLVVDRAQALPAELLQELADFARQAGIRLWLIWVASSLQRPDLGRFKLLKITAQQFRDALPATPAPGRRPPAESWPALPSSDFPVFMEVCRARIDPAGFRRVAETFDLAREAADEMARDILFGALSHPAELRWLRVEAWLRDQVLTSDQHPSQLLVKLRGIQTGFFLNRYFLRWRPSLLPRPAEAHLPTRLTDDVATRLRGLCRPDRAAALVVQLHLAADPSALRVGHLSADGAAWTQPASSFGPQFLVEHRFPRSAHGILAAHLAQRRADGAGDDSALFARIPPPASHETLRLRFGLAMLAAAHMPAQAAACSTPWLRERGLSLHRIDTSTARKRQS